MTAKKKIKTVKIKKIEPGIVLRGGRLEIISDGGIPSWDIEDKDIFIGEKNLKLIASSSEKILAEVVGYDEQFMELPVLFKNDQVKIKEGTVYIPIKICSNHILGSSPVCDIYGNIYFVDLRELQENQQSIIYKYLIDEKKLIPYIIGIPAPTSLSYFEGVLYITSMVDRKLYRCVAQGEYEVMAQGLGSVFGTAVNSLGEIFVGDQTGSVFKVDSTGKAAFFTSIPESFKGYHFVFSKDDDLFISIPSNVGKNSIYRVTREQSVKPYLETMNILGGIAINPKGEFFWVENTREDGAVFKIDPEGHVRKILSASFILGLTFSSNGDLVVTDLHNIYIIKKHWMED
ncbi:MAG TPA: hypothetical protein DHW82_01740 [Spirochaetia bacterium]|nr:MAG: hypothetical protein A2Y41_13785 [Spirochaetes bacterium GWB1_36_13]HCL55717.1 hypothetical protein [Spirochaetia bacterium]